MTWGNKLCSHHKAAPFRHGDVFNKCLYSDKQIATRRLRTRNGLRVF